jgi:hypothetical protein
MESVEDIEDLHMRGARAVFTVEEGEQVSRKDLATAFEEQGMEVTSFEQTVRPRAKARYTVDAGIT